MYGSGSLSYGSGSSGYGSSREKECRCNHTAEECGLYSMIAISLVLSISFLLCICGGSRKCMWIAGQKKRYLCWPWCMKRGLGYKKVKAMREEIVQEAMYARHGKVAGKISELKKNQKETFEDKSRREFNRIHGFEDSDEIRSGVDSLETNLSTRSYIPAYDDPHCQAIRYYKKCGLKMDLTKTEIEELQNQNSSKNVDAWREYERYVDLFVSLESTNKNNGVNDFVNYNAEVNPSNVAPTLHYNAGIPAHEAAFLKGSMMGQFNNSENEGVSKITKPPPFLFLPPISKWTGEFRESFFYNETEIFIVVDEEETSFYEVFSEYYATGKDKSDIISGLDNDSTISENKTSPLSRLRYQNFRVRGKENSADDTDRTTSGRGVWDALERKIAYMEVYSAEEFSCEISADILVPTDEKNTTDAHFGGVQLPMRFKFDNGV